MLLLELMASMIVPRGLYLLAIRLRMSTTMHARLICTHVLPALISTELTPKKLQCPVDHADCLRSKDSHSKLRKSGLSLSPVSALTIRLRVTTFQQICSRAGAPGADASLQSSF